MHRILPSHTIRGGSITQWHKWEGLNPLCRIGGVRKLWKLCFVIYEWPITPLSNKINLGIFWHLKIGSYFQVKFSNVLFYAPLLGLFVAIKKIFALKKYIFILTQICHFCNFCFNYAILLNKNYDYVGGQNSGDLNTGLFHYSGHWQLPDIKMVWYQGQKSRW